MRTLNKQVVTDSIYFNNFIGQKDVYCFWILCDHNANCHDWPPDTEWGCFAYFIHNILLARNWN